MSATMTSGKNLVESKLRAEAAFYRHVINSGDPWIYEIKEGQHLRIVDLHGRQSEIGENDVSAEFGFRQDKRGHSRVIHSPHDEGMFWKSQSFESSFGFGQLQRIDVNGDQSAAWLYCGQ